MKRICFLLALLLIVPSLSFAQSPELFQQALLKENGEGNLEAAVELYERIVNDSTAAQGVRAQAQLHIGMCWEKMGDAKAQEAYENVLQHYGDQIDVVQQARERLTQIEQSQTKTSPVQPNYVKLIETAAPIASADYSPDGQWIVYLLQVDEQQELWLMNQASQQQTQLLDALPLCPMPRVRWSASGNFLAYLAASDLPGRVSLVGLEVDLKNGTAEGAPVSFVTDKMISTFDWHPQSEKMCFVAAHAGQDSLFSYDIAASQVEFLTTVSSSILNPVWSENGDAIYFMAKGSLGRQSWDTFRFDTSTGAVNQMLGRYAVLCGLDDSPTLAVRKVAMGPPLLTMINLKNDKKLELTLRPEFMQSMNVSMSSDGQTVLLPQRRKQSKIERVYLNTNESVLISPKDGYYFNPLISPSGNVLAFVESDGDVHAIHVQNLQTTADRIFSVETTPRLVAWSPDETLLIYESLEEKNICQLDIKTGKMNVLDQFDQAIWKTAAFSGDGQYLVYPIYKEGQRHLVLLHLPTGKKQVIRTTSGYMSNACWLPNQQEIIFAEKSSGDATLIRLNVESHSETILHTDSQLMKKVALTPDGQALAFVSKDVKTNQGQIYVMGLDAKARRLWPETPVGIENIAWASPSELVTLAWDSNWSKTNLYRIPINATEAIALDKGGDSFSFHRESNSVFVDHEFLAGGALWELVIPDIK